MRSFSKTLAILLAISIFAQSAMKTVIVVYYYANKAYIAKNLCENRNKPASCCEGKCQLKKWMTQDEPPAPSGSPLPDLKNIEEIQLFYESWVMPYFPTRQMIQRVDFPPFIDDVPTASNRSVFHPPDLI